MCPANRNHWPARPSITSWDALDWMSLVSDDRVRSEHERYRTPSSSDTARAPLTDELRRVRSEIASAESVSIGPISKSDGAGPNGPAISSTPD